jgi:hypothetical protein
MTHTGRQARYRTGQAERAPRRVTANPRIVVGSFTDRAATRNFDALIRPGSAPRRETRRTMASPKTPE